MTTVPPVPSDTDRIAAIRRRIGYMVEPLPEHSEDMTWLLSLVDSLQGRLNTAEVRLADAEQECDDLAIQRNHLKNRLEDLGVIVDDED